MPTNNTLASSTNFGLPFVSYFNIKDTPQWYNLSGLRSYFSWFLSNPVFYSIVMIKAREYANMRLYVRNKNTLDIEPLNTRKSVPAKIYRLLNKPNAMQKRWEFLQQRKIFREVCGNSMTYANSPYRKNTSFETIVSLWNVWPQYMQFELAGSYFDSTEIGDVIKSWRFEFGNYKKTFQPWEIIHQNSPNIDPQAGIVFGTPTACSLTRPLTNIDLAYESRNVIMQNRGMDVIFTSDKSDESGKIALNENELKVLDREMKKYGTLEDQKQFFFSSLPIKVIPINRDVRKLGLFDEISGDTKVCGIAFGTPTDLIELSLQGRTYENQEASLRRLYQGALIPESEDDIISLNEMMALADTDWEIIGSFDHVPCLQESKSSKAEANNKISTYMEKLFWLGGITLNQWLTSLDVKTIKGGDVTILEMDEEQRNTLLLLNRKSVTLNNKNSGSNGNQGQG